MQDLHTGRPKQWNARIQKFVYQFSLILAVNYLALTDVIAKTDNIGCNETKHAPT